MENFRLIVADDHSLIRAGLRSLIENVSGVEVVGEAGDGLEVIERVASLRPHLLLTDIAMPRLNGLLATERVVKEFPEVKVIIVSMYAAEEFVIQAVKAGAAGYLLKDTDSAELQVAIHCVMQGGSYFTPAVSKNSTSNFLQLMQKGRSQDASPLTPRQREILRRIADGQSTKTIAQILEISVKTVDTHRSQIMDRLQIYDIPGLVRYAMRTGMVPPERDGRNLFDPLESFPNTEKNDN